MPKQDEDQAFANQFNLSILHGALLGAARDPDGPLLALAAQYNAENRAGMRELGQALIDAADQADGFDHLTDGLEVAPDE